MFPPPRRTGAALIEPSCRPVGDALGSIVVTAPPDLWGYIGGMPKVSVYLPDELYRAARDRHLSISVLTQRAIEQALGVSATNQWVERMRSRPARSVSEMDTAQVLDEVRSEFGA